MRGKIFEISICLLILSSTILIGQEQNSQNLVRPSNGSTYQEWSEFLTQSEITPSLIKHLENQISLSVADQDFKTCVVIANAMQYVEDDDLELDRCPKIFEKLLTVIPKEFHSDRANLQNEIGIYYNCIGRTDKALAAYQASCEEMKIGGNEAGQAIALGNIAGLFEDIGDLENAIKFNLETKQHSEALEGFDRNYNLMFDNYRLGRLYAKTDQNELAIRCFEESIQLARDHLDNDTRLWVAIDYLSFLVRTAELKKAKWLIAECELLLEQDISPQHAHQFQFVQAAYYLATKRVKRAAFELEAITRSDCLCNCTGCREKFLKIAGKVYLAKGEVEQAYEIQSELIEVMNSKMNKLKDQERKNMKALVEFEYAREADQLEANSIAAQAKSTARIRNLSLAFASSFAVFAGAAWLMERTRREQLKKLASQKGANQELSEIVEERTAALVQQVEERIQLQKVLNRKQRLEAVGQLTGGVAHDFNNLLQVILTSNEMLELKLGDEIDAGTRAIIDSSTSSAETGAAIIQQLLAFARQQVLTPQTIDIVDYFNSQIRLIEAAVGEKLTLDIDFPSDQRELFIRVDPAQLTTAIINLTSNSRDAIDSESGEIKLTAKVMQETDKTYWPSQISDQPCILISVKDNGSGMSEEELDRAVEPFFTTKPQTEGYGLGLSSVEGFIKQSNGDILIESSPEFGTVVSLAIPIVTQEISQSDGTKARNIPLINGSRLLIVEDNLEIGTLLKTSLSQIGFVTETVASADAAVELLEKEKTAFDCVLSDVRMPGKRNGVELCDWILENCPGTPVILMTGYSTDLGLKSKDVHILSKPFSNQELLSLFRQQILINSN